MGKWRAAGGGHSATHFKKSNSIRTDRASLNLATLEPPRTATRVTFWAKVGWEKEMHDGKTETTSKDNSFKKCV